MLRTMSRQFTYSLINIVGLSLGLASSLVIFFYVYNELSYDRHFKDADRIFRVNTSFMSLGNFANGPRILVDVLREEHPEVERATRIKSVSELWVFHKEERYREDHVFYVDDEYFKIFSHAFEKGNAETVLNDISGMVIRESMARKYFGDEPAMGKSLIIGKDKKEYIIKGIISDDHRKSHLRADIWLPITDDIIGDSDNWTSATFYNYVKLREGVTQQDFQVNLEHMIKNHVYPDVSAEMSYEQWAQSDNAYRLTAQPLTDIYLHSKLKFELSPGGSLSNVIIFASIALFIIAIAVFNFVNLTTARAAKRAKEVGIRKTLGTKRKSLIYQFLFESVFTSLLAMILAFGFAEIFLIIFKQITGQVLIESVFTNTNHILIVVLFSILTGLVAGIYPAFYLTRFRPISVIKGSYEKQSTKGSFRNVLVVLQFVISITLIICSAVVLKQLTFLEKKDLGFDQENVLVIRNAYLLGDRIESFRQSITSHAVVEQSSLAHRLPAGNALWIGTFKTTEMAESLTLNTFMADQDFLPTLDMKIVKGRNFSKEMASDSSGLILNESAVKTLGLGDDPVGKKLNTDRTVIGVVSDFNFETLRKKIEPAVIGYSQQGSRLLIKLRGKGINDFVNMVSKRWKEYTPDEAMKYYFLDENFSKMLKNDEMVSKAISIFTILAIFISCLGLFGLSTYVIEQRTKEIGIRKVLGASAKSILYHVSKDFMKLILIAFVIAIPLSYYLMIDWLANFAYQTNIGVLIFLIAGAVSLVLALFTIAYRSIKASLTNPVLVLRDE
ncbi:ABC transporter permease [Fulvivirgaceae bacterium BMA10]|uniref:ABC transporter permease n=1 Tax=Splendidivirga corallicola TaxID=3051826 RepID=A0ABT8KVL9_9BACT|nr:ABC transporter permease [Fulvivirgaceae bacterium BMA10]